MGLVLCLCSIDSSLTSMMSIVGLVLIDSNAMFDAMVNAYSYIEYFIK